MAIYLPITHAKPGREASFWFFPAGKAQDVFLCLVALNMTFCLPMGVSFGGVMFKEDI